MGERPRFAVVNLHCRSYAVRDGKMSWSYDRSKAEEAARIVGGVVVDADEIVKDQTGFFNKHQNMEIKR